MRAALFACLIVLAFLLTGCGEDSDTFAGPPGGSSKTTQGGLNQETTVIDGGASTRTDAIR